MRKGIKEKNFRILTAAVCLLLFGAALLGWGSAPGKATAAAGEDSARAVLSSAAGAGAEGSAGEEEPALTAGEDEGESFRAVWVATISRLDYPSAAGLDEKNLAAEADAIVEAAADMGFDAVILQVRPSADALYPSELFPWSRFLSGTQGLAPGDFDPLDCFISAAHARGLELHAWINPYRVTASAAETLSPGHPASVHPEWTVRYDGKLYFNPGLPEVRQLVVNGVREILENYPVDGIHLDDYFYPGRDFDDGTAYAAYGGGLSLADWRRQNNDLLIEALHELVDSLRPAAAFGVSPCPIWANRSTRPEGSATSGYEALSDAYADTRGWVKKGWLDYIAPQIYFPVGHSAADFEVLAKWWSETVRGTGVRLYIGQAVYQADSWGLEELYRQEALIRSEADGCIMFRMAFLTGELADYAARVNPAFRAIGREAEHGRIEGPSAVAYGEDASLTFVPDNGYFLQAVLVDGRTAEAPEGRLTLSGVTGDVWVRALFWPLDCPVTAEGEGRAERVDGDTFRLIPAAGWEVAEVSAGGRELIREGDLVTLPDFTSPAELFVRFVPASGEDPSQEGPGPSGEEGPSGCGSRLSAEGSALLLGAGALLISRRLRRRRRRR